jgi:VCBS repeat-containing protein
VWTYTLNNALAATQALTEGEVVTQTYTARVTDDFGAFVDQTVTVLINGTNDAAVITGDLTVNLLETDAILTTGGQLLVLTATDVDSSPAFVAQTGVAGNRGHGTFSINAAGAWTYNANTAHNEFVAGLIYSDSLTVATADGTTQVITVNITGTEDAPMIKGDPTEGQVLTATNVLFDTNGMLVPVTYQWFADGVAISNATDISFTVTGAELAKAVTVQTTYAGAGGHDVTTESAATMAYVVDASVPDAGKAVVQTIAVTATGATTTTPVSLALNSGTDVITLGHQALDGETIVIPAGMVTPLGAFTIAGTGNTTGSEHFSLYVDSALAVNGYWVENAAGTLVNLASAPYGGAMVTENGKTRLDFTIADNSEFDTNQADHGIATTGLAAQMGLSIIGHVSDVPTAGVFF